MLKMNDNLLVDIVVVYHPPSLFREYHTGGKARTPLKSSFLWKLSFLVIPAWEKNSAVSALRAPRYFLCCHSGVDHGRETNPDGLQVAI